MAAQLSVTYTPYYNGCHRICFKTTETEYCTYLDESTSIIGVEKTTVIDLTDYQECLVNYPVPIGCGDANLIGYVQPCCTDATSLDNRVSFSTTYEQTACTSYNILCNESGIGEITLTDPGYGWLPFEVPTIDIIDNSGFGSGATAEAIMICDDSNICHVDSILITDAGQNYYFADQISVIISPPPSLGGTPATAEVAYVDDCGTFTVAECDGTDNPTTYQLWGGDQYAINVCSGLIPTAYKYVVTTNPTNDSYGPELLDTFPFNNTNFTGPNLTWGPPSPCNFLVPHFYVDGYGSTIPIFADNGIVTSPAFLEIGAQYRILYTTYTDNPPNKLVRWTSGPGVPIDIAVQTGLSQDVEVVITANSTSFTATVFQNAEDVCFYITSVKKILNGVNCCDCVKYDIINLALSGSPINLYFTDCFSQQINTVSVNPQETIQICSVYKSIWPENATDNQYIEIVYSDPQDC